MTGSWTEVYRQHFQDYFAKPFDIQTYRDPHGVTLKLATHDWAREGYRVYASMGLADQLAAADDEDPFGEVILYCDVPDAEVPQLFVNALFFILRQKIPLGARFSLSFLDLGSEFARRFRKTAFYFADAEGPDERFGRVRRGEVFGRVYQAYFLAPEEDEFLEEQGIDAFEAEFMKLPDRLSVRRQPCV